MPEEKGAHKKNSPELFTTGLFLYNYFYLFVETATRHF